MARIRTIKPSFWGSQSTAGLSRDARLLAIGLISFADDDGRFLGSTAAINGFVFPNDDLPGAKVRKWLVEIQHTGLIHEYQSKSVTYGCFPTWHDNQVINRYTPSILPEPDVPCTPRGRKEE
jgi:DNA replication protein DnaT